MKKFFWAAYYHVYPRYYLFLHSWELAAALWVLAALGNSPWAWGLAAGLTLHLLLDQLHNPAGAGTYFLLRRAAKGFQSEAVFPPDKVILTYPYLIDRYRPPLKNRTTEVGGSGEPMSSRSAGLQPCPREP